MYITLTIGKASRYLLTTKLWPLSKVVAFYSGETISTVFKPKVILNMISFIITHLFILQECYLLQICLRHSYTDKFDITIYKLFLYCRYEKFTHNTSIMIVLCILLKSIFLSNKTKIVVYFLILIHQWYYYQYIFIRQNIQYTELTLSN